METETEHKVAALYDVRLAIFGEHEQLAELVNELESHANGVIKGDCSTALLDAALVLLHGRFVRHLDSEEARLLPLLSVAPKDVAAALRGLLGEHADQRARIDGLLQDRTIFTDVRTLAREALTFVREIRLDIADEDAALRSLG